MVATGLLYSAEGKALGDVVAHEVDDESVGHDGERAGRRQQAKLIAGRACRSSHGRGDRLGGDRGQCLREQQLDPGKHKAEERRDPDAGSDRRQEYPDEEATEGIAVDIGGLVQLLRHPGHEALQNPHRQRNVEQAMGERHGDVGVEQVDRGIKLKERQGEDRRRCLNFRIKCNIFFIAAIASVWRSVRAECSFISQSEERVGGGDYDIAIIGGGSNSCGIARDAAGRGLSVLLAEQGDLAGGTSSAATKLVCFAAGIGLGRPSDPDQRRGNFLLLRRPWYPSDVRGRLAFSPRNTDCRKDT